MVRARTSAELNQDSTGVFQFPFAHSHSAIFVLTGISDASLISYSPSTVGWSTLGLPLAGTPASAMMPF